MKTKFYVSFCCLIFSFKCFSQIPIDVADLTLKVKGLSTEEIYYGFAEGDKLIFNFEEVDHKELKEVEIIEYPSTSRFMDYETKKIENKNLNIIRKAVYKFRFYNSSLAGKICRIKIQRIPASDMTKIFNTEVAWKTIYDTTYEDVQERFLAERDTVPEMVTNSNIVVHSTTTLEGTPNKSLVEFALPDHTVCWTYWIGVNQAGVKAYENAQKKFLSSAAQFASKIPDYGPLLALGLYGISYFSNPTVGANVCYYFIQDPGNANLFMQGQQFYQYKQGMNIIADFGKIISPNFGKSYLGLVNQNMTEGVSVNVKILAIRIIDKYGTRVVKKRNVTSSTKPIIGG